MAHAMHVTGLRQDMTPSRTQESLLWITPTAFSMSSLPFRPQGFESPAPPLCTRRTVTVSVSRVHRWSGMSMLRCQSWVAFGVAGRRCVPTGGCCCRWMMTDGRVQAARAIASGRDSPVVICGDSRQRVGINTHLWRLMRALATDTGAHRPSCWRVRRGRIRCPVLLRSGQ